MRDILITLIVLVGCIYTLKRSYIGILLWSWLGYMNPHRLAFGFSYDFPFAQITAIVLLGSIFFNKQKQALPINNITITWIIFILFMCLTTLFAYFPDDAQVQLIKVLKIQLIVFLTMIVITDLEKLKHLIWVVVLSIGYFSVKGGIFTILSGGSFIVWGPPSSFIEDNNALAVCILMVMPFMAYLRNFETRRWLKNGLTFAIATSFFTVLGSQSRGALLAITAVALFYWIKSKQKIGVGILIVIIGAGLMAFMPESWHARMDTIQTYEEDESAMGRINAWEYAFNAANHNLLGMGFDSWSFPTFLMYAPIPEDVHAAHSIYFSVLADHGWLGLFMFVMLFFFGWRKLSSILKITEKNNDLAEINFLARMMQVGFIAYLVGGAFLSISYFDLPWHYLAFVVLLEKFVQQQSINLTTISASNLRMQQTNKLNISI